MKDVHAHLGHADGAVTLNIYSAVLHDRADDLADRLDALHRQGQNVEGPQANGTQMARAEDHDDDHPPAAAAKVG